MLCINWYQRGCHYFFPSHCRYFDLLVGYLRIETTSGRSNLIKLCASDIPWRCWHCIPYKLSFPQSFRFNFLKEWGQTKNDPSRNQIHDPSTTYTSYEGGSGIYPSSKNLVGSGPCSLYLALHFLPQTLRMLLGLSNQSIWKFENSKKLLKIEFVNFTEFHYESWYWNSVF